MSKSTISTFQLFALIPNAETARLYLEKRRWPNGAVCPNMCGQNRITARKGGYYRCNACKLDFTVRTATVFERSHIPLHKWGYAMYLVVTARKGISSMQLAKEIGITQKSAWFMLQRLREACAGKDAGKKLFGVIEMDETFVGGKEKNKHANKKLRAGRGSVGKTTLVGMRQRGGRIIAKTIKGTGRGTLHQVIRDHIGYGSVLCTDEASGYTGIPGVFYEHYAVAHGAGEYVRDGVHTNGIESVWSLLKRGINGTWHQVSAKHLDRYVNEVVFRLNDANVAMHTLERLDNFIDAVDGKRLTYERLIA